MSIYIGPTGNRVGVLVIGSGGRSGGCQGSGGRSTGTVGSNGRGVYVGSGG